MRTSWSLVIAMMTSLCGDARAQSLADVANAEASRRAAVKTPAKRYTNDNLTPTPAAPPVPAAAPTLPPPVSKPEAAAGKQDGDAGPTEETKTEKYWKDRAAAIRQSLARNTIMLDAFRSQLNGLNAEFLSVDDPGRRALLEKQIQNASAELKRVEHDIEKHKQAAIELEEQARKAGVPPGWLR